MGLNVVFTVFGWMPATLRRVIVRLVFYPTLWWNQILNRLLPSRRWWDRVDQYVILGALPVSRVLPSFQAEAVRGVINMCEEFAGPLSAYERMGIRQLHLPTIDFSPPALKDIERGVAFIEEHAARKETVYVHCKAGRGRSATVVLCWLMKSQDLSPEEAQQALLRIRPHIASSLYRRASVTAFREKLTAKMSPA